jgi:membrane-associated protease RseP (regulator of RpoE activity)
MNMLMSEMRRAQAPRSASVIVTAACAAITGIGMIAPLPALAAESSKAEAAQKDEHSDADREQKLAAARKRLDEAAREVAALSMQISQDAMPRIARVFGGGASRAMLGVNIGSRDDKGRKDGVEVLSVSPGGPAAEAGIKAGDVIVELNGKSLKESGDESSREKLLAAMREVTPEEKIAVRYLRDGKTASATVVARPVDRLFTMPRMSGRLDGLPNFRIMRADGMFGSAELVPLTPKLGQYFGADKGLLVVRAPDTRMQLEEGDVIIDIDGRVPANPAHAYRILDSYQSGEKVKLNVLRMKKRMTIDVTVPEAGRGDRFERSRFFVPPPGDVLMPAPAPAPPGTPAVRVPLPIHHDAA